MAKDTLQIPWETFPALNLPGILHGFSQRSALPLEEIRQGPARFLEAAGFPADRMAHAEQVHGNKVAFVDSIDTKKRPHADALVTQLHNVPLVVYVADCGPVYFYDPAKQAIGLAHSGRKGTEGNIVGATITAMESQFGTQPRDLIVQLGPCIRPPHYEVDFAAHIEKQARDAGVVHYSDCKTCTASHVDRYYSYRAEKGQTGRLWAVLMLR